ncbi:MAG: Serine-type D-Ala-D-Ala carboxypeptidase [Firmicutes bacterium]|nr:Serine-type D-Ala-D-Ala carboxypeptidase [Bacillota bacterium]
MKLKKKRITAILSLLLVLLINASVLAAPAASNPAEPSINGLSAITIDLETNEIIYEKSIDQKMYPASTTKLLTALLLAESKKKTDLLTYTASAKSQPEFSMNLNLKPIAVGETMSAKDVMLGLLLYSGNDAAYMAADNVSGNNTAFMAKMNEKIASLGLKGTHFVTPNGLHDANHYTTAYDLSIIGKAAFANEWVREAMGTKQATITTSGGASMLVENRNKLLGLDGCIGGKTGYTSNAGKCLVAVYERDGRKILGVVLSSVYDAEDTFVFNDMKEIIDYSYAMKQTTLHAADSVVKTEKITYKPLLIMGPEKTLDVPLIAKTDVKYYENDVNKTELKETYKLNDIKLSTLTGSKSIATMTVTVRDSVQNYEVFSSLSVFDLVKANILFYAGLLAGLAILIAIIVIIIKKIRGGRRRGRGRTYYY